jgi:hypothetical protein
MRSAVRYRRGRQAAWGAWLLLALLPAAARADATKSQEDAVKRLLATYQRAIETKDLGLFRSVKPNLTGEEERRLRKAFDSTKTQQVTITVAGVDCQEKTCVVRLNRRDTLDATIVSSFPQTMRLTQAESGLVIEEIGR